MSSLGSLVVSLSANTAQFTSDMGKAAHISEQRMKSIKSQAAMAGKAISAMFAAGVGASAVLIKQSMDNADQMQKTARSVGIAVEAYSTLTHAASLGGVEQQKFASALKRSSANLFDIQRGAGQDAKAAFDALGISVDDANGNLKSNESVLMDVADRFSKMEDGTTKTALAVKIFGRAGADMISMLNTGSQGIKDMQEEARLLGGELSGDLTLSAEQFNDNISRMILLKRGFANELTKAVLPALTQLTDRMVESAKASNGLAQAAEVGATGMKLLLTTGVAGVGIFKTFGEALGGLGATIGALASGEFQTAFDIFDSFTSDIEANIKSGIKNYKAIWEDAAKNTKSAAPSLAKDLASPASQAVQEVAQEAGKMQKTVETMISGLQEQYAMLGKSSEEMTLIKLAVAGATEEQQAQAKSLLELIDARQADMDMAADAQSIYESTRTAGENYAATIEKLQGMLSAGAIDWDTYGRAVAQAKESMAGNNDGVLDGLADIKKATEGWGDDFTNTFVDGVMEGKFAFKDLANSIISDIMRIIVKKQVLNAIGDFGGTSSSGTGILGMIGSFFGSSVGASSTSGMVGSINSSSLTLGAGLDSFDGGGYTGSGMRSGGVDGKGGFPAILHPNETVIDHSKGQSESSTQSVSVNYAPQITVDSRSDRAQVLSDIQRMLKNHKVEMYDEMRRNPRLATG